MKKVEASIAIWLTLASVAAAQTWTQKGPLARYEHTAVFDPNTSGMIVFGGQNATTTSASNLNDVWVSVITSNSSRNVSWTALAPTGAAPTPRLGHTAVYDATNSAMTIFGGGTGSVSPEPCLNDVWVLAHANGVKTPVWGELSPAGTAPAPRVGHTAIYDPNTNTMIVFGGSDCAGGFFNDVWVLSNANGLGGTPTWSQLATAGTAPAARESATAVYDPSNNIMIVFGGDDGASRFGDVWTLSKANGSQGTPVWTQLAPSSTGPAARSGHSAIYDAANNLMVIFGGNVSNGPTGVVSDSWMLAGANGLAGTPVWSAIVVSGGFSKNPPRSYHTAVYRPSTNEMVVFGGKTNMSAAPSDDHIFVLALTSPQAWSHKALRSRYRHTAVFDPATNKMIVFGGQHTTSTGNLNDVWETVITSNSSGSLSWNSLPSTGAPPTARLGHTAVYDALNNVMTIFGGGTGSVSPAPCLNDVWTLTHANGVGTPAWAELNPAGTAPAPRIGHTAIYDPNTNTMIVFGGSDCAGGFFNDVWVLSNANGLGGTPTWSQLATAGTAPAARESATAVYDPSNNIMIVFGGNDGASRFGDVWTLSKVNGSQGTPVWTQLAPSSTGPAARSGHTAVYNVTDNRMTIFGGSISNTSSGVVGDSWVLDGANGLAGTPTWSEISPTDQAPLKSFHSAVYRTSTNEMITFAGKTSSPEIPADDHIFVLSNADGL